MFNAQTVANKSNIPLYRMATENSFLEKAGIQLSCLLSNEDLPCLPTVTNGIVLELFVLHKRYNLPSKHLY